MIISEISNSFISISLSSWLSDQSPYHPAALHLLMGQPDSIVRLEAIYYKVKMSSSMFSVKLKFDYSLTRFLEFDMFHTLSPNLRPNKMLCQIILSVLPSSYRMKTP